jgi:hypothetical protein
LNAFFKKASANSLGAPLLSSSVATKMQDNKHVTAQQFGGVVLATTVASFTDKQASPKKP